MIKQIFRTTKLLFHICIFRSINLSPPNALRPHSPLTSGRTSRSQPLGDSSTRHIQGSGRGEHEKQTNRVILVMLIIPLHCNLQKIALLVRNLSKSDSPTQSLYGLLPKLQNEHILYLLLTTLGYRDRKQMIKDCFAQGNIFYIVFFGSTINFVCVILMEDPSLFSYSADWIQLLHV